ncbi:MAG: hypothetical protein ACLTW9_00665 [Enterocloster sp.]
MAGSNAKFAEMMNAKAAAWGVPIHIFKSSRPQ